MTAPANPDGLAVCTHFLMPLLSFPPLMLTVAGVTAAEPGKLVVRVR